MKKLLLLVLGLLVLSGLLFAKQTHAATGAIYAISAYELPGGEVLFDGKTYRYWGDFSAGDLLGVQALNFKKGIYNISVVQKIGKVWVPVDALFGCAETVIFNSDISLRNIPMCVIPSVWSGGIFKVIFDGKSDTFKVP